MRLLTALLSDFIRDLFGARDPEISSGAPEGAWPMTGRTTGFERPPLSMRTMNRLRREGERFP